MKTSMGKIGKINFQWLGMIVLWAVLLVICLYFFLRQTPRTDEKSRHSECASNLKAIGDALIEYYRDKGCFPPPVIRDEASGNTHSWRVALLPYLEKGSFVDLYQAYHIDEPWDSEANLGLEKLEMLRYRCPSFVEEEPYWITNYVMVVPDTAKKGKGTPAEKVTVIEIGDSDIPWTEPCDLKHDGLGMNTNDRSTDKCINSPHPHGRHVLHCDASGNVIVEFISR